MCPSKRGSCTQISNARHTAARLSSSSSVAYLTANSLPASKLRVVAPNAPAHQSQALQILTQDGLITSEPQKGKYIRKMTRQEIENEYEIGGILEGAGVAAALPLMNHVDLARLSGMIGHMARLAPRVGPVRFWSTTPSAPCSPIARTGGSWRWPVPPVRTSPNFCSITIGTSCSLRRNSWIGIGIFSEAVQTNPPRWKSLNTTANRGGGWRSSARDASRRSRGILLLTPDRFSIQSLPECLQVRIEGRYG